MWVLGIESGSLGKNNCRKQNPENILILWHGIFWCLLKSALTLRIYLTSAWENCHLYFIDISLKSVIVSWKCWLVNLKFKYFKCSWKKYFILLITHLFKCCVRSQPARTTRPPVLLTAVYSGNFSLHLSHFNFFSLNFFSLNFISLSDPGLSLLSTLSPHPLTAGHVTSPGTQLQLIRAAGACLHQIWIRQ